MEQIQKLVCIRCGKEIEGNDYVKVEDVFPEPVDGKPLFFHPECLEDFKRLQYD